MSADFYSDITNGLGSKNYPKLTLQVLESAYWFLSYGKVIHGKVIPWSADVCSDITNGLGSKNYPKMNPQISKSADRIKS